MITLSQVRAVQWGMSHLWEVSFPDSKIPSPFNNWFPAINVNWSQSSPDQTGITLPYQDIEIPKSIGTGSVSISVYDNETSVLEEWVNNWIKQIYTIQGVLTLSEAVKLLCINKLNSQKKVIKTHKLLVYPKTNAPFIRSSEAVAVEYELEFIIAGEIV